MLDTKDVTIIDVGVEGDRSAGFSILISWCRLYAVLVWVFGYRHTDVLFLRWVRVLDRQGAGVYLLSEFVHLGSGNMVDGWFPKILL